MKTAGFFFVVSLLLLLLIQIKNPLCWCWLRQCGIRGSEENVDKMMDISVPADAGL